jgi:hypothetical protein
MQNESQMKEKGRKYTRKGSLLGNTIFMPQKG